MRKRFSILVLPLLFAALVLVLAGLSAEVKPASAQTMPPTPAVDRLAQPPTVSPPTQAGRGQQAYYQICMMCHGDRGQGMTDEWREVMNPEDRDCWQSGCHHPKHPPGGFEFPKLVPPVVGVSARAPFDTALDLYNFISTRMPFQARGSLSEQMYWDLTAFLLQMNGIEYGGIQLDELTAATIRVNNRPLPTATPSVSPAAAALKIYWPVGAAAILLTVLASILLVARRRPPP